MAYDYGLWQPLQKVEFFVLQEAAIGHKPLAIVFNAFSVVAATWPAVSVPLQVVS